MLRHYAASVELERGFRQMVDRQLLLRILYILSGSMALLDDRKEART